MNKEDIQKLAQKASLFAHQTWGRIVYAWKSLLQKLKSKDGKGFFSGSILRKSLIIGGFLFGTLALAMLIFIQSVKWGAFGHVPDIKELREINNPVATEVYSADGLLLGRYYLENRTNVSFNKISPFIVQALIATEDARFYKHSGVDVKSLFRVIIKSILLQDQRSGGGSTISQQLAKNLFHRKSHGLITMPVNKVREMIIAERLEKLYSKKEILTLYLNTVSFGENMYGIETASRRYFNREPDSLSIEQSAVLIGMLKATHSFNPRINPDNSLMRRNQVIRQMVGYGELEKKLADSLTALPLELDYNLISHSDGPAPYFREFLRKELTGWCKSHKKQDEKPYNLYTDGLKIYTTIDYKMQMMAEEAIKEHLSVLQNVFGDHWKGKVPWGKDMSLVEWAVSNSDRFKKGKEAGLTQEQLNEDFQKKRLMNVFTWEGVKEMEMSPLDSIIHYLMFLNAGFMAMDPSNGHIKAYVGGINHNYFKFDHVKARRQVGSTFKPIVYAAALENGGHPCNFYPNELIEYPEYDFWAPENSDGEYGGEYSMKGGLAESVNTIAVQVVMETGVKKVVKLAKEMGVDQSPLPEVPSIALGTAEVTLFEMLKVYCTIANKGYRVEPVFLDRIEDRKGRLIEKFETGITKKTQVLNPVDASVLLEMMQMVVDSGTARRLRYRYNLPNDIAGKTGTTQSQADGWFIGITPELVAGVWVGGINSHLRFRSLTLGQGANTALPIWALFFQKLNKEPAFAEIKKARFPEPSEEVKMLLDCPLFEYGATYISSDTIFDINNNVTIIMRDGKPDIIINRTPTKKERREQQRRERKENEDDGKSLKEMLKDLFGKNKN